MELPKNITQIGEVGGDCRIYVEDYVVSYMKQLNRLAADKGIALALYGRRREEEGVAYYFLYGACKVNYLQREVRHLSQAQRQEIENLRRKYFPEYLFLGYRLLNGEMVDGMHICEQEICRYVPGYAQFYEKNDPMLAYMLAVREETQPESVDQAKYEEVKRRQEERRAASAPVKNRRKAESPDEEKKGYLYRMQVLGKVQGMRTAVLGVFALLCLVGVIGLQSQADREGIKDLRVSAKQWLEQIGKSALADGQEEAVAANAGAQKDTLVMEDKLEQAILEENRHAQEPLRESPAPSETPEETESGQAPDSEGEEVSAAVPEPVPESSEEPSEEPSTEPAAEQESPAVEVVQSPKAVPYVIRRGDTLTRISIRQYGSDARVADICSLNSISNPDDIKEGQVIMLPQ